MTQEAQFSLEQYTVTESADFGFIPDNSTTLTPPGSPGCLEKRNCPLSSNLVVWCAKIGPKSLNVQKTS